ncbi:tetratricopeptide repeat protein [Sphingomonas sp. Leaf4]|uniref:tetratricopeptide repeat protein n=1 Tax=Sphingomonas sp. Leaf4 TaxID=2876553 RepID=UPI001E4076F2|nr:hypothetical protein [Sphingomonas sp. Leaf4]
MMIRMGLAVLLALWPVAARAEWHEARSDHFIVYADDPAADVARYAERLERFDKVLRQLTKMPSEPIAVPNRVNVYVTGDLSTISKLVGQRNVAGFYIPRAAGSVAFVPEHGGNGGTNGIDSQQVLFHEYTHHFMLSNWAEAAFPVWFVEGFAEFFAPTRLRDDGSVEVARPPMYRARQFQTGMPVSATMLLTGDTTTIDRGALYAGGWALTHMLLLDPTRRGQLDRFMRAIVSGQSAAKAAESFGDLKQLDRDLSRYVRSGLRYSIMPAGAVPKADVSVRALTPAEAAMMPVRIRSKRGTDRTQALALLPLARRAAAPYPNDAAAQALLAEVEFHAGNFPIAEAAAARAIAADPKSIDGHILLGRARMVQARAARDAAPERWRSIRRSFLAANTIENDDPEPLLLYYQTYQVPGQTPTANARDALLRAHLLAPQDRGLRMQAARVLLETDRADEARRVLGPVAYSPHGGRSGVLAQQLIAAIDAGGAKAALARWRGTPAPAAADSEDDDDKDARTG